MPTFVDIDAWFVDLWEYAYQSSDPRHMQIVNLLRKMHRVMFHDVQGALRVCESALQLIEAVGDVPCAELYARCHYVDLTVQFTDHPSSVLTQASYNVALASKPRYAKCVTRSLAYHGMVAAYALTDDIGYADEIHSLIDYARRELPLDREDYLRMRGLGVQVYLSLDQLDKARDEAVAYAAIDNLPGFRQFMAHTYQMEVEIASENYTAAKPHAEAAIETGRQCGDVIGVALATLALAVIEARLGNVTEAQVHHRNGIARADDVEIEQYLSYHAALAGYHEVGGYLDKAEQVWAQRLTTLADEPISQKQAWAWLHRVRVLALAGVLQTEHSEAAKAIITQLHRPAQYLDYLDRAAVGQRIPGVY